MERPRILVTLTNPLRGSDPAVAELKNGRYLDALRRFGAEPIPVDDASTGGQRRRAMDRMDGLLLSGGADLDPARYGEVPAGSHAPDHGRDEIDAEALRAAWDRGLPVLGICRGMQALNVLRGGSLVQHLSGHESEPYPGGAPTTHRLDLVAGTRLATILEPETWLEVNSYHHQAVTPQRIGPGLRIAARAWHGAQELVEGLEADDDERWVVGIQCHPERTESTPPQLERLWAAFVDASRDRGADRSG